MKKKLALLMAAIMTVAMVPMTAFASTKLTAVDEISTAVDENFVSIVELSKNDDQVDIDETKYANGFEVILKLTNGEFAKDDDDKYIMETSDYANYVEAETRKDMKDALLATIKAVDVINDTTAYITLDTATFNQSDNADPRCDFLTVSIYRNRKCPHRYLFCIYDHRSKLGRFRHRKCGK